MTEHTPHVRDAAIMLLDLVAAATDKAALYGPDAILGENDD